MREGNWIAMPRVPLIVAGGPEVAGCVAGDGADVPGDNARATKEATRPNTDHAHVDRAAKTTDETERVKAAVETIVPAPTSHGVATAERDDAPTPDEVVPAAISAEENTGGDASEKAHVAELEATLLAASSPGRKGPPEPATTEPAETPVVNTEAEV
jgi:hypothetical protein